VETFSPLLVPLLIAISAFLSGSEVAIFSLSRMQLKQLRERFKSAHRTIKRLLGDPAGLLAAILVSNEVVNVALSALISHAVAGSRDNPSLEWLATGPLSRLPAWAVDVVLGTLVASPILLILCEITPKVIAARVNTLAAPLVARPLATLYTFLRPVRFGARLVEGTIKRVMPGSENEGPLLSTSSKLREEDFLNMVEEAQKEGAVQSTEVELIRNVFDLNETAVSEITTPLSRVFMLPQTTTLQQALSSMKEGSHGQRFSRIPVYGKSRTDIVGLLYSKDLLIASLEKMDPATPITELLWKPFFVNASTRLNSLFRKMKKQRIHLAMVTNEHGAPIGVATMNDVLEALLEELVFSDEDDFDEDDDEIGGLP
jgi:putative hemolysin